VALISIRFMLDNFLIRHLKGVPKTHVYRIIRSGEVRINKGRAGADTRMAAGDVVRLPPVRIAGARARPRAATPGAGARIPRPVRRRAPAGHRQAGRRGRARRQRRELRRDRAAAHRAAGAKFLELVHRLDRETSGILLVAKKRSALTRLQDQFRERETGKTYLALVEGAWPANKKVLDQPLHKYLLADGERRVKVVAKDDPDGMRSVTLVRVLAS
jgi:23S rRNA pseudouridine955/2504/2580 synthase